MTLKSRASNRSGRASPLGLLLIALGSAVVILGILVDVARVAGAVAGGEVATHAVIAAGGLVIVGALRWIDPLATPSGWLHRLGHVAAFFLVVSVAFDLMAHGQDAPPWLTGAHAAIVAVTVVILLTATHAIRPNTDRSPTIANRLATMHLLSLLLLLGTLLGADYLGRPNLWRTPQFYMVGAAVFPALLAYAAVVARMPWGATLTAGWYMVLAWAVPTIVVLLERAPAVGAPALSPPPVLLGLLVPALAVDVATRVLSQRASRALIAGLTFMGLFLAMHWLLAPAMLESPVAELYPALKRWPAGQEPNWPDRFWVLHPGRRADMAGVVAGAVLSVISSYVGFSAASEFPRMAPPDGDRTDR